MRPVHLAFVLGLTAGASGCGSEPPDTPTTTTASTPAAQPAAFELVDTEGRTVTDLSLRGKPAALYFGSTRDTGAQRAALANFADAVNAMGGAKDRLTTAFVSLDPEHDTPDRVGAYLAAFDPGIAGLTGSPEAVARMAEAYKVASGEAPAGGDGGQAKHPAVVYMFDRDGFPLLRMDETRSRDEILSELRKMAGSRYAMGGHLGPSARR